MLTSRELESIERTRNRLLRWDIPAALLFCILGALVILWQNLGFTIIFELPVLFAIAICLRRAQKLAYAWVDEKRRLIEIALDTLGDHWDQHFELAHTDEMPWNLDLLPEPSESAYPTGNSTWPTLSGGYTPSIPAGGPPTGDPLLAQYPQRSVNTGVEFRFQDDRISSIDYHEHSDSGMRFRGEPTRDSFKWGQPLQNDVNKILYDRQDSPRILGNRYFLSDYESNMLRKAAREAGIRNVPAGRLTTWYQKVVWDHIRTMRKEN